MQCARSSTQYTGAPTHTRVAVPAAYNTHTHTHQQRVSLDGPTPNREPVWQSGSGSAEPCIQRRGGPVKRKRNAGTELIMRARATARGHIFFALCVRTSDTTSMSTAKRTITSSAQMLDSPCAVLKLSLQADARMLARENSTAATRGRCLDRVPPRNFQYLKGIPT